MIKAVIFDLDGVLVDAREIHYEALNNALARFNYTITREEHLSTFDGLPTKKKLKMLTEKKGLPTELYDDIWKAKQEETIKIVNQMGPDERLIEILKKLKEEGHVLASCSNSIRESTKIMLLKRGFLEHLEFFLSNEDVVAPKPSPEMYLRAMIQLNVKPKECLIIEDSHIGRQSAIDSGAHLCGVEDSKGVTYEKIKQFIEEAREANKKSEKVKWQDKKMNIVVPMAGEGTSYKNAGYTFPKLLVDINGKPMLQVAVENLNTEGNFIFLVKKEHHDNYNLKHLLNLIAPGCRIIQIEKPTQGAACTALLAKEHINNESPLLIANPDQFIEWNSNEFFYAMAADECDGGIPIFRSTHPRWSYVKLGEKGFVTEVAEKKTISDKATVGLYFYKRGSDFVRYAEQMIEKGIRTNDDFYVCPVYNEMIQDNKKIRTYEVEKMWGLGTPEELNIFLNKYDGTV
jgi:HAD superfamily hydrolase (TIGR01509 family)